MAVTYQTGGGRATITIDDPEHRNPMSVETMGELLELTRQAMDDSDVGVVVYTGAGDQAFSAGGDLSGSFADDPIGLHRSRGDLADLFRLMIRGGKPTVARGQRPCPRRRFVWPSPVTSLSVLMTPSSARLRSRSDCGR